MSLGDEAAFEIVFQRLLAPLHYYALKLVNDNAEAEDMVSLAFHKLLEGKKEFKSFVALRSYLFTVIRRQCIDLFRHRQVVDNVHQEISRDLISDEGYVEAKLFQTELMRVIYEEMQQLPAKYRDILQWTFIEELTPADMALRLGVTEGHIRADRSRGLVLLRNALKNKGLFSAAIYLYIIWLQRN
ncbi:hypothetical protein UNH65_06125 [Chitinophaga sp. 180180018-2]|nr:hypothetical protein [Chitinophaga sp. 212800010-3]